jgi:hypothetical protein
VFIHYACHISALPNFFAIPKFQLNKNVVTTVHHFLNHIQFRVSDCRPPFANKNPKWPKKYDKAAKKTYI